MALLPKDKAKRVQKILSQMEVTAHSLMSQDYAALPKETTVSGALTALRSADHSPENVSYVYIVDPDRTLLGVVDARELILADPNLVLADLMASPVVAAEQDDLREDLAEIFLKYHFRMVPVADAQDHILGVIRFSDIVKGLTPRYKG
jgi:magnesium transporter